VGSCDLIQPELYCRGSTLQEQGLRGGADVAVRADDVIERNRPHADVPALERPQAPVDVVELEQLASTARAQPFHRARFWLVAHMTSIVAARGRGDKAPDVSRGRALLGR